MLRVLVFTTLFPDASRPAFGLFVERQIQALARQDGIEIEIVAPIGIPPWPLRRHARYRPFDKVPDREVWNGLIVHRPRFPIIPLVASRLRPAMMAKALAPALRDIRERFPFNVIDTEFFYPEGPAAVSLGQSLGVPVSVTARGSDIHYWAERAGASRLIRKAGREADGLVAVSEALRDDLIELGMPAENIAVHYAGVDKAMFRPIDQSAAKARLGVEGPLIVSVGSLIPLKQQDLVISAMTELTDAQLWLLGEGTERPVLERQISELELDGRVRLLGSQPPDRVAEILGAADVMALPSAREGLANAWLEALACGTPIVITDVGGAREVVRSADAGALVAPDPQSIAAAIENILADPPDRGAVRAVVEDFSWDAHSRHLAAHLQKLAGPGGDRSAGGKSPAAEPAVESLAEAALTQPGGDAAGGASPAKLRVLTLATLFPDSARPRFGIFVEQQTLGLAKRDDVELQVVAPIGRPPWPFNRHPRYRRFDDVPEREDWKGLTVYRPRFTTLPRIGRWLFPRLLARRVNPLLRDIRQSFPFDVIDAEFFYPDGPAARALAEALDVPFSVKARGSDIHFWGARPHCRAQIVEAGRNAGGLLAVSEALKRDMAALGINGETITVHYTGIDKERFKPVNRAEAKAALGISGPLVVTVGALIELKGQDLVVQALALLPDARALLIGEGPSRAALEAQIKKLGLADRIRMPGNLPHDEVARYLAAADVMALPSASEGLANVWVEALASGTPIVISDAGGAQELMDRPEAGAIVPREPQAIAEAIGALLANPPPQDAVRATVDRFSWERNADTLFAHLAHIAQRQ